MRQSSLEEIVESWTRIAKDSIFVHRIIKYFIIFMWLGSIDKKYSRFSFAFSRWKMIFSVRSIHLIKKDENYHGSNGFLTGARWNYCRWISISWVGVIDQDSQRLAICWFYGRWMKKKLMVNNILDWNSIILIRRHLFTFSRIKMKMNASRHMTLGCFW